VVNGLPCFSFDNENLYPRKNSRGTERFVVVSRRKLSEILESESVSLSLSLCTICVYEYLLNNYHAIQPAFVCLSARKGDHKEVTLLGVAAES